jgi:hypothetical protein
METTVRIFRHATDHIQYLYKTVGGGLEPHQNYANLLFENNYWDFRRGLSVKDIFCVKNFFLAK